MNPKSPVRNALVCAALAASLAAPAWAGEGGTSHPVPGSMSTLIDAVPSSGTGLFVKPMVMNYRGTASALVPTAAGVVANLEATVNTLAVVGGYYDDWRSDGDKQPLYAGLVYSFAAAPLIAVCSAMNARLSSAASRRTAFRSELAALGGAFGVTIVMTGIFWVVFVVLAAQLPVLSVAGRELTYTPPSPHLNWLVPLLAPFIWLGVALRPRPASNLPASMMTMAFLIGYNTIVFYPYAGATLVVVGLAAGAGLVAFVKRRRWWQNADLAV